MCICGIYKNVILIMLDCFKVGVKDKNVKVRYYDTSINLIQKLLLYFIGRFQYICPVREVFWKKKTFRFCFCFLFFLPLKLSFFCG